MSAKKRTTATTEPTFASLLARRGGKYLSEEEKHEYAERETPFTIKKIVSNKGSYGKRWELTISDGKKDRALTIPSHAARDETFSALRDLIEKRGPQGPAKLSIREMDNGQTWLSIVPVKNETKKGR